MRECGHRKHESCGRAAVAEINARRRTRASRNAFHAHHITMRLKLRAHLRQRCNQRITIRAVQHAAEFTLAVRERGQHEMTIAQTL